MNWTDNGNGLDIKSASIHEIGHLFGLSHSLNPYVNNNIQGDNMYRGGISNGQINMRDLKDNIILAGEHLLKLATNCGTFSMIPVLSYCNLNSINLKVDEKILKINNPVNNYLKYEISKNRNGLFFDILNMFGESVAKVENSGYSGLLDISQHQPGIYFIKLFVPNKYGFELIKFVKQ